MEQHPKIRRRLRRRALLSCAARAGSFKCGPFPATCPQGPSAAIRWARPAVRGALQNHPHKDRAGPAPLALGRRYQPASRRRQKRLGRQHRRGCGSQRRNRRASGGCDFRRSGLHTRLGLPDSPGFSDVLNGECSLDQSRHPHHWRHARFSTSCQPAGRHVNAVELLASERLALRCAEIRREFDFTVMIRRPSGWWRTTNWSRWFPTA